MRLLRCHIENFGKLSDRSLEFEPGLNRILAPNGFGKTTLAAFIKAMLFGLPRTSSRDLSANERKKYMPWQGGPFGGFLEFEHEGAQYRVTRFFGKTAAKDTFELFDLSAREKSARFSEKLGEELFHLDGESFARSVYMPQLSGLGVKATDSIRAKLGNLVEDTDDLNNYDTAVKRLKELRTEYHHYRGNGGRLPALKEEIHSLDHKLYSAGNDRSRLKELLDEIKEKEAAQREAEKQRERLQERFRAAAGRQAERMRAERLQELEEEERRTRLHLKDLERKYPAGHPSPEELKEERSRAERIRELDQEPEASSSYSTLPEEEEKLSERKRELEKRSRALEESSLSRFPVLLALMGLLLLAAGAFDLLKAAYAVAAAFLLCGAAALFAALRLRAVQKKAKNAALEELREETGQLEARIREQAAVRKAIKEKEERERQERNARREREKTLQARFLARYFPGTEAADVPALLEQAAADGAEALRLKQALRDAERRLEQFQRENPRTEPAEAPEEKEEPEELKRQEEAAASRAAGLEKELRGLRLERERLLRVTEQIPADEDRRAELIEEASEAKKKLELLDRTIDLLGKAKDRLSSGYSAKVEKSFARWAETLMGDELGRVIVDKDLNILVDEAGQSRETGFLSAGTADGIAICMRLALTEALFEGERPFLILDDPFVNLDDAHTERALKLVERIAGEYQVLYLVCNSSRSGYSR